MSVRADGGEAQGSGTNCEVKRSPLSALTRSVGKPSRRIASSGAVRTLCSPACEERTVLLENRRGTIGGRCGRMMVGLQAREGGESAGDVDAIGASLLRSSWRTLNGCGVRHSEAAPGTAAPDSCDPMGPPRGHVYFEPGPAPSNSPLHTSTPCTSHACPQGRTLPPVSHLI